MQSEEIGKIINIKFKNDKVIIECVGEKLKLDKAIFDKLDLKIGDVINNKIIKTIDSEISKQTILKYAKNLLYKRPYSEKELIKKLTLKFDGSKELKQVISELRKNNLLNDRDYLNNYVDYFNKNYFGKYFIINFFKTNGVKDNLIQELKFDDNNEKNKAREFLSTIKNKYISASFAKQKRKIYDVMLERGFSVETILDVFSELQINESEEKEQLIKEYKKCKSKYDYIESQGVDKESRIVSKLIECGYSLKLISEVINLDKEGKLND